MTEDLTQEIKQILNDKFQPDVIEIYNDSYKHAGHREAGQAVNSHFRIEISKDFTEGSRIEKHRAITDSIADFMGNNPIHAVEIKLV